MGNIRTKIPDYTTSSDSEGNYTLFRIEASTLYSTWNVTKRYRNFADLHKVLTQKFPTIKLPSLPKKKVIGSALSSFVKDRRTSLEAYLTQLVMIPEVAACPVMLEFLELSQSFSGLEAHMHRLAEQVEKLHQYCGELQYQLTVANHNIAAQDASIKELRSIIGHNNSNNNGNSSSGTGGSGMMVPAGTLVQSIFGGQSGGVCMDKAATLPLPSSSNSVVGGGFLVSTSGGVDDNHHSQRLLSDGSLLNALSFGEPSGFLRKSHSMGGLAGLSLLASDDSHGDSNGAAGTRTTGGRFEDVFQQRDVSSDSQEDDYGQYGRENSGDYGHSRSNSGIALTTFYDSIGDFRLLSADANAMDPGVSLPSPHSNSNDVNSIFSNPMPMVANVEIPIPGVELGPAPGFGSAQTGSGGLDGAGSLTRVFSPSASLWNTNTPMRNMNHSLMSAMWGDGDSGSGAYGGSSGIGVGIGIGSGVVSGRKVAGKVLGRSGGLALLSHNTQSAPMISDLCKRLLSCPLLPTVMSVLFEEVANAPETESRAFSGATDHADMDGRTLSGGLSNASRCLTWCQSFDDVLDLLMPQKAQVEYRNDVCTFLGKHVQRSALTQVYDHNLRNRCFLPHDPILISLMLWKNQESGGWYVRLNERLCRVAGGIMSAEETANFHAEGESCQPHNLTNASFGAVVGLSSAFKVQCTVDNALNVEIRGNMRKDLCFQLFIEEFDRCIDNLAYFGSSSPNSSTDGSTGTETSLLSISANTSTSTSGNAGASTSVGDVDPPGDSVAGSVDAPQRPNLFKKSLLLIRAWWCYEVAAYTNIGSDNASGSSGGTSSSSGAGSDASYLTSFLPDSALTVMVCAVFTKYREVILHPFHALVLFLSEYAELDFAANVVTVNGIVPMNTWNEQLIAAEKEREQEAAIRKAMAERTAAANSVGMTGDSAHSLADLVDLVLPSSIHELYVENTREVLPSDSIKRLRDLAEGSEGEPEILMPMVKRSDNLQGGISNIVVGVESSLNFVTAGEILPIAPQRHSITVVHPLYNTNKFNIMTEPGNTPVLVDKFSSVLKHAATHLNECLLGKNSLNIENVSINEAFSRHHASYGAFFFKRVVEKFGQAKNSKPDVFALERQFDRTNSSGVADREDGSVCSGYGFSNNVVPVLPVSNKAAAAAGSGMGTGVAEAADSTGVEAETMAGVVVAEAVAAPVVYAVGPNEVSQQRYDRIGYCKLLVDGTLADGALRLLVTTILRERVGNPLPVGEIGKLIQEATVANNITTIVKERYGGLKKFMEMYKDDFVLSKDHPYNPHVFLKDAPQYHPYQTAGSGIGSLTGSGLNNGSGSMSYLPQSASKHKGGGGGANIGGGNVGGSASKMDMRKQRRSIGPGDFMNQYNNGGRGITNHHMQYMQGGGGGLQQQQQQQISQTPNKGLPRNSSFNTPDKAANPNSGLQTITNTNVSRPGPNFVMRGNVHSGTGSSAVKAFSTPPSVDSRQRNQHYSVDGGSSVYNQQRRFSGSPTPYQGNQANNSNSAYGMLGIPDPTAPSFVPGGSTGKRTNK